MTQEEIYQEMLDVFQQETGYQMHSRGDLAVRLQAAAAQIMSLYHYGDYVYHQAFPQTAQEESLDLHGALRGVPRKLAQQATGALEFQILKPLAVDLTVKAGVICLTPEGVAFETVEDGIVAAGNTTVTVAARAVEPGFMGNAVAESITRMQTAPDGVSTVINPLAFSGGRDEEDDENYRRRIMAVYRGLSNGANLAYYRELALSVEGIDDVRVIPRVSGAGSVGLLVTADSGAVSEAAVAGLEALLEDRRELGIEVVISSPEEVVVDIEAKILPAEGVSFAQAKNAVAAAAAGCFTGDKIGKTLYLAALSHSAMATGTIDNIVITAPSADVTVGEMQLPVLGELTLEAM